MRILLICIITLFSMNCKSANEPIEDQEKLISMSEEILTHLDEGNFESVREDFNEKMMESLTPAMLKNVWEGLEGQIGTYQEKGEIITDTIQGMRVVYIICKFEKQPFKLKVVFDDQDLVAGLFIIPVNQK